MVTAQSNHLIEMLWSRWFASLWVDIFTVGIQRPKRALEYIVGIIFSLDFVKPFPIVPEASFDPVRGLTPSKELIKPIDVKRIRFSFEPCP